MKKTTTKREEEIQKLRKEVRNHRSALKKAEADIAELRRQLEQEKACKEQLVQTDARYRQIIENIREGYFETDLQGRITFCNKAMLEISGYTEETLVGALLSDFTPPHAARAMDAVFRKVLKDGTDAAVGNYEVFHKAGNTLIVEFDAGLIKDAEGQPVGFKGIIRDVSEKVKAADAEKRSQSQMQQVQKMEALGTLAGGLAHGFNNVLMAIQGNLSIIRMNLPRDHALQVHLERINQATERGGRLAKEILSFAKVGRYVVMPTNLNKILKSTSRMFLRSNSSLHMHEIYEPDLWETRVDRVQIGQVLLSLYMNAAEAMPQGGDLYLQSENVYLDEIYTKPFGNAAGRYVKISVTDSGEGLEKDARRRIFEPFFSPYRPIRYEGLGLAAAYGTIKSHNGIINVYSQKGHGTTFNIYLPVIGKDQPEAIAQEELDKGTETVLIVDDDPTVAQVGRDILERLGYRVMMAASGAEAIDIYREYKNRIHLVLLDVILPDLSGEQVFIELKKRNPNVLVIIASGYNVNRAIDSLLSYGCADFVQKPFLTRTLSHKVRKALDSESVPAAARLTS